MTLVVVVVVAMAVAALLLIIRRARQPLAARPIGVVAWRARPLLTDARPAPVAHAVREHHLQTRELRGAEHDRRIVRRVQRLEPALQDVLRQRAAGDLARR